MAHQIMAFEDIIDSDVIARATRRYCLRPFKLLERGGKANKRQIKKRAKTN